MTSSTSSRGTRSKTPGYVGLAILGLLVLIGVVSYARERAAARAAHNLVNPIPTTPAVLAAAKTTYNSQCASCHGSNGDGKGDKAQGLWKAPTNFRDVDHMSDHTDGDLYWVTTKGNWPMPAFENKLSSLERWQLVDYIRSFAAEDGTSSH